MSDYDYPKSAGQTFTVEELNYYKTLRSNSPQFEQHREDLRQDMCKLLGICVSVAAAAALTSLINNYSGKGGTRKRSTGRGRTRGRRGTGGSMRRNKRSSKSRRR